MKNIIRITVITIVVAFLSTTYLSAQEHNHTHKAEKNKTSKLMKEMKKIDKNKDGVVYECPMKCEAPKDAPGECSKCGMKLQKISIKDMNKKGMKDKMNHGKMKTNKNTMHDNIKAKGMHNMKMDGKQNMKTLEQK